MLSHCKRHLAFVLSLAAAIGAADPAFAADVAMPVKALPAPAPVSAWSYKLTPYFWAPSLNGHSTIKGVTTDIDASFIDLLHRKIPKELFGMMASQIDPTRFHGAPLCNSDCGNCARPRTGTACAANREAHVSCRPGARS